MKYLSQNDPQWAGEKIGQSNLTIGRYGCTLTGLSMLSDYFKCYKSPVEIAHNVNNFTKDGLVIWKNLKFEKMQFIWRGYTFEKSRIEQYLKDPDLAVLIQVNGNHWVVGMRKNLFGNDYTVLDPWTGKKCSVLAKYKKITGAAYFSERSVNK